MQHSHFRLPTISMPFFQWLLKAPFLFGLICFLVYNANMRQIGAADTLPARYLPLILWRHGTLELSTNARLVAHGHPIRHNVQSSNDTEEKITYLEPYAYWLLRTQNNELASLYPVITPLIVAPLYLPAVVWLNIHGWQQPYLDHTAEVMEKISASLIATITSVLMYWLLRRQSPRWSLPLAIAFAFGTNTWMISSQALWQHGTGALLVTLALLLVNSSPSPGRAALLGATCVLMAGNRPPDALIAGAVGLFAFWHHRNYIIWFFAGAAIPLAALLYYNLGFMGHIAGGYGMIEVADSFFQPLWTGLAGLLISPTRGLLIFSPFLIFVPIGLYQRLRTPDSRWLAVALSGAILAQLIVYALGDWRAGHSWGPRWLTNMLPVLVWMLAPALPTLRPFFRNLFTATVVMSIGIQIIGAFWYTQNVDRIIYREGFGSMKAAWDPANLPFVVELGHPPAQAELLCDASGSIDRIGKKLLPKTGALTTLKSGMILEGWALACGKTPARILVLIDGIVIGSKSTFSPRQDINQAMRTNHPSGWRISANTFGVSPGKHILQLAAQIGSRSDLRIIKEYRVVVAQQTSSLPRQPVSDAELNTMAIRAAALLKKHQKKDGFWLTAHTHGVEFKDPKPEMNTFLTSMLVDLLDPIANQHSLEDAVRRARQHLALQIESDGLVRYHGRPDGPSIGRLGCIITPDSDDSALVWRITATNSNDPRFKNMLGKLAEYRDAQGLYRTWLAPQAQYQCINPGSDPNPADITIQIHIYLMLQKFDPPAAQDLCNALRHAIENEAIWVYYRKAPLIPYLRKAEMQKSGCTIPLSNGRLENLVTGQEFWGEAIGLLTQTMLSKPDGTTQQAIRNWLTRTASNDFALVHSSPPLLYHNDMTASGKRFYWSEDFGYALWMRLYEAAHIKSETNNAPPSP